MKTRGSRILMALIGILSFWTVSSSFGQAVGNTATLGSTQVASRADTTSNYVDWWQARTGPGVLISLFGYNSGAQQFLQIFDSSAGPTVSVTAWNATSDQFVCTNHGLSIGERVQLTGTVAGISAGIYYASQSTNVNSLATNSTAFYLYDTLANALAAGATGRQDVTGATSTATMNRLPIHAFAIGATDNFSCIVPNSGMSCEKGVVVANSTTAATYTAASKNLTLFVTVRVP